MAQTGLVLELQRDALNQSVKCSEILRKALVVSKKLKVTEICEWIDSELNGYSPSTPLDQFPPLRIVSGRVEAFNPYHGYQPVGFRDSNIENKFSRRCIFQSISELEHLLEGVEGSHLQVPFSPETTGSLMQSMNYPLRPTLVVPDTEVTKIIEGVRNLILKWALELEEGGITGAELSFTAGEKTAASLASYSVVNNIGSMSNSQLQQQSPKASQSQLSGPDLEAIAEFLSRLRQIQADLNLSAEMQAELDAEIVTMNAQVKSPKPKSGIITESLTSIRRVLEGAGGGASATGLVELLSRIMS